MLPIEFLVEELKTKILEIDFAFLFGSYANGTQRPDSDLDIAVYLNIEPSLDLISRSIIETATGKICDLCILNNASEILRFEVLNLHSAQVKNIFCILSIKCIVKTVK